ncbi:MAG: hypothetical protein E2O47_07540 [Gemmatimonadetes bacterium]|nr:MAG: hypothetical protein E2O47_07540 [Gemmatimonadota bacterium]
MIEITERKDVWPICPYCEQELTDIHYEQLRGKFFRRYLYFCSHCHKVLGVSERKSFWVS